MFVQTQDPGVPASVPRTTTDVTSPAESSSTVSVSNFKFCWSKKVIEFAY